MAIPQNGLGRDQANGTVDPQQTAAGHGPASRGEIVIARYAENLDWVREIPPGFDVVIYNKGAEITSPAVLKRAQRVVPLKNSGRESDTFLRHMLAKQQFTDGYTVFLQGGPFEHSPDLLGLLRSSQHWKELQPLSWRWLASRQLPPPHVLASDTGGFVDGLRVRPEPFSLHTWGQLQFFDSGTKWLSTAYREQHGCPEGINVAAHFLNRCEWTELADRADRHLVGSFSYGALFAVRQHKLQHLPRRSLELALEAANSHEIYGYVLERLWLHMLGEPFQVETSATPYADEVSAHKVRFVPPTPRPPLHLRVVPRIKRQLSSWVQS